MRLFTQSEEGDKIISLSESTSECCLRVVSLNLNFEICSGFYSFFAYRTKSEPFLCSQKILFWQLLKVLFQLLLISTAGDVVYDTRSPNMAPWHTGYFKLKEFEKVAEIGT